MLHQKIVLSKYFDDFLKNITYLYILI